jgi:16S rRNA (adenine1518-N6/adenine1519-N6)-dimethyltransferase
MRVLKRFGQHFLEPAWVDRVVEVIAPRESDVFLEIGPGRGALTMAIAPRVRELVAVEIDRVLAPALAARVMANVRVIEADFLKTSPAHFMPPGAPVRVAGNLPYNISTPILFRLLDLAAGGRQIVDATVMLQREVADRLGSSPGSKDWGVLSACQQLRATVRTVLELPPGAFRPVPKVRSAVVRITYHAAEPEVRDADLFQALVRAIFMQRRKMLSNALASFATAKGADSTSVLTAAGIDERRRPETLSVAELVRLADVFVSV